MTAEKQQPNTLTKSHVNTVQAKTKWTSDEKAQLAVVLGHVFEVQKQYGKSPASIKTLVEGFAWVLSEYPLDRVVMAIGEYIKRHPDIPAPANITAILDPLPPPPWVPDWSYYNRLKKMREDGGIYALQQEEEDFMKKCEAYSLGKAARD